jgi:UPF0716 family protein affecting phage T7 exclusion
MNSSVGALPLWALVVIIVSCILGVTLVVNGYENMQAKKAADKAAKDLAAKASAAAATAAVAAATPATA